MVDQSAEGGYRPGDLMLAVRRSHRWYWLPRFKAGGSDGRRFGIWWLGLFAAPYPPMSSTPAKEMQ